MATLAELIEAGAIFRWEVELDPGQQPERLLLLSPRLADWLTNVLPTLGSDWNIEETPELQLDAITAEFVAGEPLTYKSQIKPIRPHGDGVWELKTADLRLFGWYVAKDCFLVVAADQASKIKEYDLYNGYRGEVVRFREQLPLDEPKFVVGEDPNDVVSNYRFPA